MFRPSGVNEAPAWSNEETDSHEMRHAFYTHNRSFPRSLMKKYFLIIPAVLSCIGVAYAGSLSPSASPAATSYTLSDIYTRLTTNALSTAGNHDFTPSGSPAASHYTLTQVYDAIPTITANLVKLGTAYLGVEGTLTPDGGTATTAAVFTGSTAHLTADWTLDTGTLTLACVTSIFDGTANKVPDTYDGAGDGTNRFCMTDSGDAAAGDLVSGKIAWVDGSEITGSMTNVGAQTITPTTSDTTITAGYHNGVGYCAGDVDLITENIKSGVTIFGVAGDSSVVDTTSGDAAAGDLVSGKIAWVDGSEITGSMTNVGAQTITPTTSDTTITAGYHSGAGYCAGDADLITANIKSGINIFGVAGDSNVVDTSSGDATAGNILATKKAWVDGTELTGTMPTPTLSFANDTVNAGYYSATTLSAIDTDLAVGNIKSGTTIFGVEGTYVGSYGIPKTEQTTSYIDYDDGYYEKGAPNSGDRYTDNGDGTITDNATGLEWVKSGYADTDTTPATTYTADGSWRKYTWNNALLYAERLDYAGHTDWRLPNVKEIQSITNYEVYNPAINTTYFTNTSSDYYFSSTTAVNGTGYAWCTNYFNGSIAINDKTAAFYVRPVRGGQ